MTDEAIISAKERLIGRHELTILNKETHYSSEEIEEKMSKMLDGVTGSQNKVVSEAIKSIKLNAMNIVENSKDKGFIGNLITKLRVSKENLVAKHKELKSQIDDIQNMLNAQNTEIQERIPQIEQLLSIFVGIETDIKADLKTAEDIEEYINNTLAQKKLEMELDPTLSEDYSFGLVIQSQQQELSLIQAKKDELKTKRGHYAALAQTTVQTLGVAREVQQQFLALKTTILPLWRSTAVSTTINNELAEKIRFAQSMKKGVGEVFVANAEQSAQNAIAISELRKEGILSVDNLQKVIKIMEEAEKVISKNEQQQAKEFANRDKLNEQYIKSISRIKETKEGKVFASIENIENSEDKKLTELEKLKKEMQNTKPVI